MIPDFDLTKFLTATAGAVVSMAKWPGTLVERAVMGAAGVVISYFASDAVSALTSVPPGLCGFLLGLFGMSIVCGQVRCMTQTGQVRTRHSASGASDSLVMNAVGWVDRRGRDA